MKMPKRIAALLTISLVVSSVTVGISNAQTSSDTLKGSGRWETAIEISKKGWNTSKNVILVNDNTIVDALTATPFAGSKNAPILLTQNNKLDDRTKVEITRLKAEKVYLIGGTKTLGVEVENQLKSLKIEVERISGSDRYQTALEIAKKLDESLGRKVNGNISKVVVVNGEKGLADAVSAGAAAAQNKMPIILSNPQDGIKSSVQFIKDKGIKESYVVGGVQSVSEATKNSLPNPQRLSGNDRNETNAAVISGLYGTKELKNAYVTKDGMNKSGDLIDSLAVGSLAAKNNSPVVLVGKKLSTKQEKVLNTKSIKTVTQVGGSGNESAYGEIKKSQDTTVYEVKNIEELKIAIAKADANDIINIKPTGTISNDLSLNTNNSVAVNISGTYTGTVTVTAPNADITNKGTINKIVVKDSKGGTIVNESGAKIEKVEIQGSSSNVVVKNNGKINDVKNDAKGTSIKNEGTITNKVEGSQTPSVEGTKPGGNSGGSSSGGTSGGSSSVKDKLVTSIGQLDNTIKVQDVANGTELSELNLPKELSATVHGVANTKLGVTWTSTPAYIGTKAGTYTFNATLSSGYKLSEGVFLPSITVKVAEAVGENETIKINDSEALKRALELQKDGQKWEIYGQIKVTEPVVINKNIDINGINNAEISKDGEFVSTIPGYENIITIDRTNNVKIRNLKVTDLNSNKSKKSGMHIYLSKDVILDNVTLSDNGGAGLIVNGSSVTATNLTTSGNGWYGVNVEYIKAVEAEGIPETNAVLNLKGDCVLREDTPIQTDYYNETKTTVDGYGEAIITDLSDGSKSATWGKASITIDKIESIVKKDKIGEDENGFIASFDSSANGTPVNVHLNKGKNDYSNVRVKIKPVEDSASLDGIQLVAQDTTGKWYNIVKAGWGSPEGFLLESAKTPVYLVGNQEGTYKVKIELVDLSNLNKVIAETIASVIVK